MNLPLHMQATRAALARHIGPVLILAFCVQSCADPRPTAAPPIEPGVTGTSPEPAARATTAGPVAGTLERRLPPGFPVDSPDCVDCYLRWVELSGAQLHGADLRGSDLSRANLSGADLTDADLLGADLRHARLAQADLSGARWVDGTTCTAGSIGSCRSQPGGTSLAQMIEAAVVDYHASTNSFIVSADSTDLLQVRVCKWYGDKSAAISLTYDSAYGTWISHRQTRDIVARAGLPLNHEIVTSSYQEPADFQRLGRIHTDLLDLDMHVFGHGHFHVDHDSLGYDDALASFTRCFDLMRSWGLQPRAYAYPHSAGYLKSTQDAVRDAGFICARGSSLSAKDVQICPDDVREPENWYYLPAVSMGRYNLAYVNNTDELVPILKQTLDRNAWVILMYHAIGTTNGWGYYPLSDFYRDVKWIEGQDFWGANMDDAAAYIYERNALQIEVGPRASSGDLNLVFEDFLDDATYDQPLTIDIRYIGDLPIRGLEVDATEGVVRKADGQIRFDVRPDGSSIGIRLY